MEFQVDRSIFSQVEAVSNKTKMFVSCKRRFSVYDFWNDGSTTVLIDEDSEEEEEEYEDVEEDFSSSDSYNDEWWNVLLTNFYYKFWYFLPPIKIQLSTLSLI